MAFVTDKKEMSSRRQHLTFSEEETIRIGEEFGKNLQENAIVCFFGDLAAGKTTFIKGVTKGAAKINQEEVNSPTFVYLNIYEGKRVVYHFDLYRLKGPEEFLDMGFDEYLFSGGVSCIEWSERIASLLPPGSIRVSLSHEGKNKRSIVIDYPY